MEGLRRLTQLYSDTKKSCDVVAKEGKMAPRDSELISLHLEYRIQRERLSAWGLEWSDENAAEEGSIDEAVARAGLTSTVGDVLQNILNVLEEAEQLRAPGTRSDVGLKSQQKSPSRHDDTLLRWSFEDRARYEALAKDLTTSIDLLYDLSRTRRELRQGIYLTGKGKAERPITPPLAPPPTKSPFSGGPYSESEETLINPSRASTSKTLTSLELPSRLDPSLLELPDEEPPPYDSIGATQSSRMVAYLKQPQFPSSLSSDSIEVVKIPVLVEFAPFDPAYRATGVSPPSQRLDALLAFYARTATPFYGLPTGALSCLGFFEDPKDSRYGLVYEIPKTSVGGLTGLDAKPKATPSTLLKVLQASSRTLNKDTKPLPAGPALEDRFRMAFNLIHGFSRMHVEENLTHKDINSGNIIFFAKPDTETTEVDIRNPYITSCDLFGEFSLEKPPSTIARNIYRTQDDPKVSNHRCSVCKPQPCKCSPYRFDIYSLALVLLEIGLWMNLADLFKQKYTFEHFKYRIDTIWVKRLSSKCGTTYMKVVEDMLTKSCGDIPESALLGYYNKWLSMLQKCCSIDEAEDHFPIVFNRINTPPSLAQSRSQSWSPNSSQKGFAKLSQSTTLPFAITEAKEEEDSKGDVNVPTMYQSAAKTIQRAWRSRSSISRTPFQDYRRKITLIQSQWRRKKVMIASRSLTASSEDVVVESELVREVQTEHSMIHIERNITPRAKLRIYNVKLQPEVLDMWHDILQPRLEHVVERALRHSPESASMEIHMVGESELTCKPTIFVTCTSTSKVRGALARRFSYDPELFDLKVRRGKIRRSKATRTQRSPPPHRSMVDDRRAPQMPLNPFHQTRPLCGASIGAFVGKHLPPVSFGGVVDVDGELYGMTVHHLLDDPSEDEDDDESVYEHQAESGATRSSGRRTGLDDFVRELGGHPTLQSFPTDSIFPLEISDEEDPFSEDDDEDQDSSDAGYESEEAEDDKQDNIDISATQGDILGIAAGSHSSILVTQPALDDVDDNFFPCDEDRDEDHLDSHTLGHVYASSGIKRWNRKGVLHEIDWALLKLNDDRMQPCNLIQGGRRYCRTDPDSKQSLTARLRDPICRGSYTPEEDEFPTQVAPSDDLRNMAVHCFGRTSGLQGGCIGPAMSSVRIYKRRSFSRSWYIMGDFGVGGDSGAWVIDNEKGQICGHVLAWCERNSIAYICPADVLLEDMKRTLNATRVCLPGSLEERTRPARRMITAADSQTSDARRSMSIPDISRLGLGTNDLMHSRLNGNAVSPRMEFQRLFGNGVAR